jgi:hypothetical protein
VSASSPGQQEQRTRVMCHLPLSNAAEDKAFAEIINYLKDLRTKNIGVTGYTFSEPGTFKGFWWSDERDCWVDDCVVLLIVDYKVPRGNPGNSLLEHLDNLKKKIESAYSDFGSPQQEVWLVTHRIDRTTG